MSKFMHRFTPTRIKRINSLVRTFKYKGGKVSEYDLDETLRYLCDMAVSIGAMKSETSKYGEKFYIPYAEIDGDKYTETIDSTVYDSLTDDWRKEVVKANCVICESPKNSPEGYQELFNSLELVEV